MAELPDQDGFVRIAEALQPYVDHLVIAGAWAHRLFTFHPLATPRPFQPLMSEDADVATPDRLPALPDTIAGLLQAAGFLRILAGSGRRPSCRYYVGGRERGLYVEFIAPLRGSGRGLGRGRGSGRGDDAILEIAGVTAPRLRFVDLLFVEPWSLILTERDGFRVGRRRLGLRVANPVSYLAQKVLTIDRRSRAAKKAKDVLYVHDTLGIFGDSLASLAGPAGQVLARLPARTRSRFHRLRVDLFLDPSLMEKAAVIARATGRPNPPSAHTISAVCRLGLEELFSNRPV